MNHNHGYHWKTIDQDNDTLVREILPRVYEEGEPLGGALFSHKLPNVPWKNGRVVGLKHPDAQLSFILLVVTDLSENNTALWSGYPFCAEGSACTLVVDHVEQWPNGIEGIVSGHTQGGGRISFFDPLYCFDKDQLRVGQEASFILAALAYDLRKSEQSSIVIDRGPLLDIEREQSVLGDPSSPPSSTVTVSLAGMAAFIPRSDPSDDAELRFMVDAVSEFSVADRSFVRLAGTVMRLDGQDVQLTVYASRETLDGYSPQVGDDVEALVWVQGFLSY